MEDIKINNSNMSPKRLHILYAILAIVVVAGCVIAYQINKNAREKNNVIRTQLTTSERRQIVSNLEETISQSPPLTDKQRSQVVEVLKKTIANQK